MRILIAEDDFASRKFMLRFLSQYGECDVTVDGMEAVDAFLMALEAGESYDLVCLDIMMPELDGFSAVREIRRFSTVPVIMLSARTEDYDKISGFELGADDYVEKPFSPKILMLRVAALLKRAGGSSREETENAEIYRIDGLCVDVSGRIVTVDGVRADMSPKEYDLLFYMIRNRGLALSREKLITSVWGYDYYGDDRTLDTHIKLLRKSLGKYSDLIVTLRGVGYRFESEKR